MYKFLARRIYYGFITIEDVPENSVEKIKEAYFDMYGKELG